MTAAVILAGGKSSRMKRDKLSLEYAGESLLERAVNRFSNLFDEVLVSVAEAGKYPQYSSRALPDVLPGLGPLSGLHAALERFPEGVFLAAGDMPFADPKAALRIIELARENGSSAAALFWPDGRCEPLFAYYTGALLRAVRSAAESGNYRIAPLLENDPRVLRISPRQIEDIIAPEKLFMNVNRPADYDRLLAIGRPSDT